MTTLPAAEKPVTVAPLFTVMLLSEKLAVLMPEPIANPGSPTDRRQQPFCTYMTGRVDDGALTEVVLHRLEK